MIRAWKGKTPQIDPTAFVSEFAYVIGDVEIGPESSVWPGAVIRGDVGKIVIGRGTCVQDNTTVHCDGGGAVIGDYVVMGHNVLCHGDRIGDGVTLGNGAIVNGGGAEVGEYSIVAAGAVVLEGQKVQANTLVVGIPAQARAAVSEQQRERFRRNAEHYIVLAREYKAEGGLE